MFRASDIFGRRAGAERPSVKAKAGATQKRHFSAGPTNRTWDPATGQFIEEDMPADIQELLGVGAKKQRITGPKETSDKTEVWGTDRPGARALGPASVGMAPAARQAAKPPARKPPVAIGRVDITTPSIEISGFSKVELNDRYYEKPDVPIHGRPTYWTRDSTFFVYWQGQVQRWSICDAASLMAVKAGQYPGWAYNEETRHLCFPQGWMEAWNGTWQESALEVIFRSSAHSRPQWIDPETQKGIVTVEYKGFAMKELNTRYNIQPNRQLQGRPSYWDNSGVYFIYWQSQMSRWAICDLKCLDAVKAGQCPGWCFRSDNGHFANACGWCERRGDAWTAANVETAVIGACSRGLKVEFSGFSKRELNTSFAEKPGEEIQGKPSYWDASGQFFVYWQSSMKRWAICDLVSLQPAKSGLSPGWAYRTDSKHFARSSGWMEVWGRDWKPATVHCTILEGHVREDVSMVKTEEDGGQFSVEQYRQLVEKVYSQKNPAKINDVPNLMQKYEGREGELFKQVCEKYRVDADALTAELAQEEAAGEDGADAPQEEDPDFAHLEGAEVPDLTATEYAVLIQSVYIRYNPKKLQDMGRLLQKFRHRERELYVEVCKKYGVHPAKFHARQQQEDQQ